VNRKSCITTFTIHVILLRYGGPNRLCISRLSISARLMIRWSFVIEVPVARQPDLTKQIVVGKWNG
jgi:hypothetical protein